jgi:hypothetical protein
MLFEVSCGVDAPGEFSTAETEAELGAPGPIRGRNITRHLVPDGRVLPGPVDLQTTPIEVQVEHGAGFDVYPGVGTSAGTFQIDGVPRCGSYWLRVGTSWYLTRERVVDVGLPSVGRPDAEGASAGTSLVLDVDGLAPVTSGDDFQLESANAGIAFYSTASLTNAITHNAPAVGATTLAGAVFPFDQDAAAGTSQFPLIQASRGDSFTIAQLTTRQRGAVTYQSLGRALTAEVEMTQGVATTVRGAMTTPPIVTTNVDYRQDAFEALASAIHPGAVATGSSVLIDASPSGRVVNLGSPDLAIANLAAGNGDQVLPLAYGNPFPQAWPVYAFALASFQVPYVGPTEAGTVIRQTTITLLDWEFVGRRRTVVAPLISPPRAIAFDGKTSADEIQITTATPIVTWKQPSHGHATAYVVRVFHLTVADPFVTNVARLVLTPDTDRIRIPVGVLQRGEYYHLQVRALRSAEDRDDHRLEPSFVPPAAQATAESTTIRVE